jgi:hypothetical protein
MGDTLSKQTHDAFRKALLDPVADVPCGLVDPKGRPATKRFDIYRNNVVVSLTEALTTAFPILEKLLGAANFHTLAGVFLRAHPPTDPVLAFYGTEMPTFLSTFAPVASLPYLSDIARVELAMRRSYHAADSTQANLTPLSQTDPDALLAIRIRLAPSAELIRSDWPIHAIWRRNTESDAPKVRMSAQDILILRPEFDPEPHLLPSGAGVFIEHLQQGTTLGTALDHALAAVADFDLSQTLGLLIAGQAIVHLDTEIVS